MLSYQFPAFGENLLPAELPIRAPAGSELQLRVLACGVCHSDLHLRDGFFNLGGGKKLNFNGICCPFTPGHEVAGLVTDVGPDADAGLIGRRVLVYPWIGCGSCSQCIGGHEHLCSRPRSIGLYRDGGFAESMIVPHERYLVDLDKLDPAAAAPLCCSGLTTYSALLKFGPTLNSGNLVIFGAGGLGLMALGILSLLGAKAPIVVEIDESKRDAALRAGAAVAVDPRDPNCFKLIRKATEQPITQILDLVGSGDSVRQGMELLATGGRLIVVGLVGGQLAVPAPTFPLKSITVQGSFTGSLTEFRQLVSLMQIHGLPPLPIDKRALDQAPVVLDDLEGGRILGRAVLIPEALSISERGHS